MALCRKRVLSVRVGSQRTAKGSVKYFLKRWRGKREEVCDDVGVQDEW